MPRIAATYTIVRSDEPNTKCRGIFAGLWLARTEGRVQDLWFRF